MHLVAANGSSSGFMFDQRPNVGYVIENRGYADYKDDQAKDRRFNKFTYMWETAMEDQLRISRSMSSLV